MLELLCKNADEFSHGSDNLGHTDIIVKHQAVTGSAPPIRHATTSSNALAEERGSEEGGQANAKARVN